MVTALIVAILAQPVVESAEKPLYNNARIISLMPETIDSIAIYRLDELRAGDQTAREYFDQVSAEAKPPSPETADLRSVVEAMVWRALPRIRAQGGSDFRAPPTYGVGNFNERAIIQTKHALTPEVEAIVSGASGSAAPESFQVGEYKVYHAAVKIRYMNDTHDDERFYFCLVDPYTLYTAEVEADIRAMLANRDGGMPAPPERWADLAKRAQLTAPILVMRRFPNPRDPRLFTHSPASLKQRQCSGYAAWLPEAKATCFQVVVHTPEAPGNAEFFTALGFERIVPTPGTEWSTAESCKHEDRLMVFTIFPMVWFGIFPAI